MIVLGAPIRIDGDVRIAFRGRGEARFRLQHTLDRDGRPDDFSWCDVSRICDGRIKPEDAIQRDPGEDQRSGHTTALVDFVNGDLDVVYRRYLASWLRVLIDDDIALRGAGEAANEADKAMLARCLDYRVSVEPVEAAA